MTDLSTSVIETPALIKSRYIPAASSNPLESYVDQPAADSRVYAAAMTGWLSAARRTEVEVPSKWLQAHGSRRWNRLRAEASAGPATARLANLVYPDSSSGDSVPLDRKGAIWSCFFFSPWISSSSAEIAVDRFLDLGFRQTGVQAVWERLFESVKRWGKLPNGWEDEDSIRPPKQSVDAAMEFLLDVHSRGILAPTGYVAGDGEIGFRWKRGQGFASVAFLADMNVVSFVRDSSSDHPFRLDVPFALWNSKDDLLNRLSALG